MAEYIEREASLAFMNEVEPCICHDLDGAVFTATKDSDMLEFLMAIPAADVVPVVRCGECKHRDPEDRKCDCGGLEHAHMFPVADDWFCADGERKDGDGE